MKANLKHERDLYATGYSESGESRDCSVRAFAVAACIDYWEAHKLFAKHGRKNRRGTPIPVTHAVISEAFPGTKYGSDACGMTLGRFVTEHPVGHFIIHLRGHALAITDGVIHDWRLGAKRIVRRYWKIV